MATFKTIEQLNEGFLTLVQQLPRPVQDALNPYLQVQNNQRAFRQQLFNACSGNYELTMDQIHAAGLNEYLALSIQLDPPFFNPADNQPSQLAHQKASSYLTGYLMNQYLAGIHQLGHEPSLINELTVNAGDLYLAQIERLRYNYHQFFTVGDYLTDLKHRVGLPAEMIAKQSTSFGNYQPETIALLGQLSQSLGIAAYLQDELALLEPTNLAEFIKHIIMGHYPLTMLFAQKKIPDWFKDFFQQPHRPTQAQFTELCNQCRLYGQQDATDIINDLIKQVRLDWQVLPAGMVKERLNQLITTLENN